MKNNIILLLIFVFGIGISSYLIYKGANFSEYPKNINNLNIPSPSPSADIYGLSSQTVLEFDETGKVMEVVDGDTIVAEINGQKVKIRYIGVDTPETVDPRRPVGCFGKEASDINKNLVSGKQIYLEKDVSNTDKYNRLLRYVYIKNGENYLLVNDYLVRYGYAYASEYPPDIKYSERFLQAQQEAVEQNRGLWSYCKE